MPGCGKSTGGRHLAWQLGLRFFDSDSDSEIDHRIGMPIRSHFTARGEMTFRNIKAEAIDAIAGQPGIVLATGGGTVLWPSNPDALHS